MPKEESLPYLNLVAPYRGEEIEDKRDLPPHFKALQSFVYKDPPAFPISNPAFTKPWSYRQAELEINLANFYLASSLPSDANLCSLAQGHSVALRRASKELAPGIISLRTEILEDSSSEPSRYHLNAPSLKKMWGEFVKHQALNVLKHRNNHADQYCLTTLFVTAAIMRSKFDRMPKDHLITVNLYARCRHDGKGKSELEFYPKIFEVQPNENGSLVNTNRCAVPVGNYFLNQAFDSTLGEVGFQSPGTTGQFFGELSLESRTPKLSRPMWYQGRLLSRSLFHKVSI